MLRVQLEHEDYQVFAVKKEILDQWDSQESKVLMDFADLPVTRVQEVKRVNLVFL